MRIDYAKEAPEAYRVMGQLEYYTKHCGLELALLELVKIRVSQINRCAYCIDRHTKDARAAGESEQRIYLLSGWRDAPCYTERERAALAWTEELTLIAEHIVSDELYQSAQAYFTAKELVDLTVAISSINAWNRLVISFRAEVGK